MLQGKVECHEKHRQDYDKYFQCIEDIDQTMKKNSGVLQKKFGNVEVIPFNSHSFGKIKTYHRPMMLNVKNLARKILVLVEINMFTVWLVVPIL